MTAVAPSPDGFTVSDFAQKARDITGRFENNTIRQAACDLWKLRAKTSSTNLARTRRYHVDRDAARTIVGITTLRDHVIAPILAGIRGPGPGRPPNTRTRIDRDYDTPERTRLR